MMNIQRRTANKAEQWAELDYQWDKIVEHARSAEQDYPHGSERGIGAVYWPRVQAAREVLKLGKDLKAADGTNACLAMYSLQGHSRTA